MPSVTQALTKLSTRNVQNQHIFFFKDRKRQKVGDFAEKGRRKDRQERHLNAKSGFHGR